MPQALWILLSLFLLVFAICIFNMVATTSRQCIQLSKPPHLAALAPLPQPDKQALAARLGALIRFKTVSHHNETFEEKHEFAALVEHLEKTYRNTFERLTRYRIDCHSVLLYCEGSDASLLPFLLASHFDVVPVAPETEAQWTHSPFSGENDGTHVWGRGALDDKPGVLGILEATEDLLVAGLRPTRGFYIALGHDEEVGGSRGAVRIVEFLKSKNVRLEFMLDEGGIIAEGIIPGTSGRAVATIGVAEKGAVSFDLSVQGPGGHSSMPPYETPIGILADGLRRLERAQVAPVGLERGGVFASTLAFLAPDLSLPLRFVASNQWLFGPILTFLVSNFHFLPTAFNAMVRTTTAITLVHAGIKDNVLPQSATATVNFRLQPGDSADDIRRHILATVNDARITVKEHSRFLSEASPVSPHDSFGFELVRRALHDTVGHDLLVAPYLVVGATDARHYYVLTENVLRFLPIRLTSTDLVRIHGVNERVRVENLPEIVGFYRHLILNSQLTPTTLTKGRDEL